MNFASRKFNKLDPRLFKSFMAVSEFGSFTAAADNAAQSLSVISRNVNMLKDAIGQELFLKVDSRQELTEAGKKLYEYIKEVDNRTSEFIHDLANDRTAMEGLVRYAMPPSCLQSPHFPMLLERRLEYPNIELKVELTPSDVVVESVQANQFDFGFVTEVIAHPQLNYVPFCEEEYVFASGNPRDFDDFCPETILEKRWIGYPGMAVPFDQLIRHYFQNAKQLTARSLYHSGEINDICGAILMVIGGLGISAFPRHCVEPYLERGELHCYQGNGEQEPMKNFIHIVTRANPGPARRVQTVIQWFLDMHPEYQQQREATA